MGPTTPPNTHVGRHLLFSGTRRWKFWRSKWTSSRDPVCTQMFMYYRHWITPSLWGGKCILIITIASYWSSYHFRIFLIFLFSLCDLFNVFSFYCPSCCVYTLRAIIYYDTIFRKSIENLTVNQWTEPIDWSQILLIFFIKSIIQQEIRSRLLNICSHLQILQTGEC